MQKGTGFPVSFFVLFYIGKTKSNINQKVIAKPIANWKFFRYSENRNLDGDNIFEE